jgi:hypothetical protein
MKNTIIALALISTTLIQGCDSFFTKKVYEEVKVDVYGNAIVIPIIINGKSYNFRLDTGATTSISEEMFNTFGLLVKDTTSFYDYYGNHKLVNSSIISEIQIGKTRFSKIRVSIIRPIQDLKICGVKIDGCLGSDFFGDKILSIDIKNRKIIFTNRLQSFNLDRKNALKIKFIGAQRTPELPIYFKSKKAGEYVWFDTGSTNYLYRLNLSVFSKMVKDSVITNNDILYTHKNNGSGAFGSQKDSINYVVRFDSIKFCNTEILNCTASTYSSPNGKSILGAPLLHEGIVTIDYKNGFFYFNRYSEDPINYEPKHGFHTNYVDEKFYVVYVTPGSLGDLNGIKKGYILKQINSVIFDSLSNCELLNLDLKSEFDKQTTEYIFEYENKKIPVTLKN